MSVQVPRKWRPTLGSIVFVVLATVMALPLVGLFFFRLYENQLVRQTEAELIAQSAVIAAVFAQEVERQPEMASLLGASVAPDPVFSLERYRPIEPVLDLAGDDILGRRPDPRPASAPSDPALMDIGRRLRPILARTQVTTLAGVRLLDASGRVIAGREEIGLSLFHVPEVKEALLGRYSAVLRARVSDEPPPPLYSLSRGTGIRIFVAMPVLVQDRVAGVVYASRTPSNVIKHIYGERKKFAFAALAVVGATLAIGLLFWRTITRPINALARRAAVVGRGPNEFVPLEHHGTREIAMLSQSFVDMTARLKERSDYIETFAAHVSHEMKTPLTAIQGAAELLREPSGSENTMSASQRDRFIGNIIADTLRLTTMLHRLRDLALAENMEVGGSTLLMAVVARMKSAFPALDISVASEVDRPIAISAENLLIVLSHLADNAACHGARHLHISAAADAGRLQLIVRDDGSGISERNRDRVFEPFFTTRRESGGTGMGLEIVRAILRVHGGTIELLASDDGTAFRINLPFA